MSFPPEVTPAGAQQREHSSPTIAPHLSLWDAVSIIVGIVVGTSIFRATAPVFDHAGGPWTALLLWLIGGILTGCGALCYAELATTYPRDGGDYEYLNRAYGPWCGFLFGLSQLATIISGNIAIMAYAFADYGARLWPGWKSHVLWTTITPVVALSALNAFGIFAGKVTQNLLTMAKVFGLTAIVCVGLFQLNQLPGELRPVKMVPGSLSVNYGLALVFVLYAFGGWPHAVYVAAEVRNQGRNLPRALLFGIAGITLIYLIVNATYVYVLGYSIARRTSTPAADVAGGEVALLVMLSALGAINGMILTGPRIYAVWGADYPMIKWLGAWSVRRAAPVVAIALQAIAAVTLILLVGTAAGQAAFDNALASVGLVPIPWAKFNGGFETLVVGSSPLFWLLTLLTAASVFVLRYRDRSVKRPFKVPMYPLPVLLFCATCMYMLYASLDYARWLSLIGFIPAAVSIGVWFTLRKRHGSQLRP